MSEHPGSARSDDTWADWARWTALAVFAALIGVGLLPLNPSPLAASVGAVVAIGAAVVLVWHLEGRYLLVVVAIAVAGVAVLGNGESTNVAWFSVCILGFWCALHGRRWEYLAYLAGGLILFAVEWLWIHVDAGWGAWMGGITLSVAAGALVRHERQLTAQLRAAQAGLAERARAEERNRIARELHDVIAHTLTVSLLHVSSARLAVENGLDDADRALAEAERLGRESLDEVRRVVGLLHADGSAARTVPLPGGGDLPALVERFRSAGAAATFTVEGDIARAAGDHGPGGLPRPPGGADQRDQARAGGFDRSAGGGRGRRRPPGGRHVRGTWQRHGARPYLYARARRVGWWRLFGRARRARLACDGHVPS